MVRSLKFTILAKSLLKPISSEEFISEHTNLKSFDITDLLTKKIIKIKILIILKHSGDPGTIRTYDLLLRRQLLYPAELRGQ